MESAIDILLKKQSSNNPLQLGFQPGKSTETAILRATELQHRGQQCIAVLDLTAAYETVPRKHLVDRVRNVLPQSLPNMVEAFLTPSWINTVGDAKNSWFVVDRSALYNLFMDEIAERVSAIRSLFCRCSGCTICR